MLRCALPRRYDGSHGVPPEIWERERSNLEAAVAKGEEGRAEVREVLARLASTRLGQHQRAARGGNAPERALAGVGARLARLSG